MFEPLFDAPVQIQIHALAATLAIALGPVAIFRRKRDRLHKTLGYAWVTAMVTTIVSSFFIFDIRLIGPFSPIHLLSLFAANGLFQGIRAAIKGDIKRHRDTMRALYFWALGIAGLFTLMPGRIMARVWFGENQVMGFFIVLGLVALTWIILQIRWRVSKSKIAQHPA